MPAPEICEARRVSPQSRRRDPAGDRGHRGASGAPPGRSGGLAGPPPNALFAEMLRAARELLAVRSPLDAELMVSELLGTWWGHRAAGSARGARRRAGIEELVGEGLVRYAAEQGSPAALALLSGIACLGTSRQAIQAEYAALALMDQGVARPAWAEHVGAVEAAECYVNSDAYGDRDEVVCVFSYAGQEQHALVVVVDYNAGGLARDGWVTSQVAKLLDYCRDGSGGGPTLHADRPAAGTPDPGGRAGRDRGGARSHGERLVPLVPRLHPGQGAHAAAGPAGRPAEPGDGAGRARPSTPPAGERCGARTGGPCWSPSSSPPTRPRTCRTGRRRAGAPTTSWSTAATATSAGRCG